MTSENTDAQTTVNDTETAVAQPTVKRPRRATRAASTPSVDAAPAEATETPVAKKSPAKKAAAKPAADDAAPAKKTTRSRKPAATEAAAPESGDAAPVKKATRTRKKAEPVDEAPAAVEVEAVESAPVKKTTRTRKKVTPVEEAPAPVVADAVESAPSAPKRRRATRQAAAPVEVVPEETTAAAEVAPVAEESTPEASPAPARRTRSRRATRPAAAAAAPVEEVAPVVESEEDEEEESTDEAPVLDVLAAFSGVTPEPGKPTAGASRLATTALLFQAPEATPRRRRRAQAPTGSPEEIAAAAHTDTATGQDAPTAGPAANAESTTAESTEDAPTGGNRRSRGRRGGRKRSPQSSEVTEDETTESAEVEDTTETTADDQTEQTDQNEDAAEDEQTEGGSPRRRRRRGGRGRRSRGNGSSESDSDESDEAAEDTDPAADGAESETGESADSEGADDSEGSSSRRRRRRRRSSSSRGEGESSSSSSSGRSSSRDEVTALRGSTRLEAKRQRRREGRDAGRRRQIITEAEFLARRESVERSMIVREVDGRTQIAVLEDGVLVEHYVSKQAQASMVGNVYLGRVQNVLPSMEAAFIDVGRGRNAVLYAGEVNWDAAGVEGGKTRRIEQALKSGDSVLVQVTKDPIGHKGARLTSQVTLAGRYLVYVPGGGMTGISRKLPDNERSRLKKILREVVPDSAGVIVRTAAEGASEEELRADIARLQAQWEAIEKKSKTASAPALLQGEPDMAIRVVRDIFNDDFSSLVIQGDEAWSTISGYIGELAPDLVEKVSKYVGTGDVFHEHRVDEQLAKGMDRKVWLPSGGSLVIDRTEAMTVVDVNTGKFTGAGGTLEETVTRNNLEAAEEIVRQLRLRDIGGIIVIDFIDMVLESNRDLVLRRLVECLGRDRTKHQVAEVTSLGLVQMTRKRVGQGLVEAFSETCEHCHGRGFIVHTEPVEKSNGGNGGHQHQHQQQESKPAAGEGESKRSRRKRGGSTAAAAPAPEKEQVPVLPEAREQVNATLATIAAAAAHAHQVEDTPVEEAPVEVAEVAAVTERPVLDVLAAFGDREAESGQTTEDAALALTPVDPSVFEDGEPMPEAEIEEISATEQAVDQGAQSPDE